MTNIKITMIDTVTVKCSGDPGDFVQECFFERFGRLFRGPLGTDVFKTLNMRQFLRDQKRPLSGMSFPILTECSDLHRFNADGMQCVKHGPLMAGANMWFSQIQP